MRQARLLGSLPALLALITFEAPPAFADLPSPVNWIIPSHVTLVGLGPSGPDSATGQLTCVFRDLAMNPMPGVFVAFDFSSFTDLTVAIDQHDPRLVVNCATGTVGAVTDVNGIARFTIIGTGTSGPVHLPQSLRIYGDGVLAGYASVAVLDRDGQYGMDAIDLSLWGADFVSGANPERADLDGSGIVNGVDLSRWAAAYFSGRNALSATDYCP